MPHTSHHFALGFACSSTPCATPGVREHLQVAANHREPSGDREYRVPASMPPPHCGGPLSRASHAGSGVAACSVKPDFVNKTEYSSHVCPRSFIPHTRTKSVRR
jgi:hypothetical protein